MNQARSCIFSGGIFSAIAMLALATFALAAGTAQQARAELQINVTDGVVEPLPIALAPFVDASGQEDKLGRDIAAVAIADLVGSGLFRAIDEKAFIQSPAAAVLAPRFPDWRQVNAQGLIVGAVKHQGDGRIRVEFRLWDVFSEQQLVGQAFVTERSNWRRVAHLVADAVYTRLTGEDGYFDTRIVYIAESGRASRRIKRLAIMDQDGANHQMLSGGGDLVLTPRFSPSRQEVAYLSYDNGLPRVHILNVDTKQRETVGPLDGMTFAPRFSPDGDQLLFAREQRGNSDIHTMDLRTRKIRKLTIHPAIDTSPSYAPDQSRIVFNSDRGGAQQLYVMDADGGNVHRISFGDGRYATPVWSPRGDLIAFTKIKSGQFSIGVMRPDGSDERILSTSFLEEGPTWAPNGRVLMFYRQTATNRRGQGGTSRLYMVDVTGANLRQAKTPGGASDPAWSPSAP